MLRVLLWLAITTQNRGYKQFILLLLEYGGIVQTPKPRKVYSGDYETMYPPSLKGKSHNSSWESTCRYIFDSKADKKRHNVLMNHKKEELLI